MKDEATEAAKKRAKKLGATEDIDDENLTKGKEDKSSSDIGTASAKATAAAIEAKGSAASKGGAGIMAVAPTTGPAAPFVAGAGAGLMTIGAVTDAKNKKKKDQYDAEVARMGAQQNALSNLSALASRMKRL